MREIIFKGFHEDCFGSESILIRDKKINGKWFYWDKYGQILPEYIGWNTLISLVSIIPETIGQFTGLLDKNGKQIFEGDILHCTSRTDSANMVVIVESGENRLVLEEKFKEYKIGMGYYAIWCFEKEVIGTIFDVKEEA